VSASPVPQVHCQAIVVHLAQFPGDDVIFPPAGSLLVKEQNVGPVFIKDIAVGRDKQSVLRRKLNSLFPDHLEG
jgi:hypothetical protein